MKLLFSEVIILLPVFKPDKDRLIQQVKSIVKQSYQDWQLLLIDDHNSQDQLQFLRPIIDEDQRIMLIKNPEHLGQYQSIERLLKMVKGYSSFVSFSDQDDEWYENKLQVLTDNIGKNSFIYADSHIEDAVGNRLYHSFYQERSNHYHDLESLFLVNTAQGANCLFKNSFIDQLLPFPPDSQNLMYDHYIALCAALENGLTFINQVTMKYIQHDANSIGYQEMKKSNFQMAKAQLMYHKIKMNFNKIFGDLFNLEISKNEYKLYENKKEQYQFFINAYPNNEKLQRLNYYLDPLACIKQLKILIRKNQSNNTRLNYAELIIIKALLLNIKDIK